MKLWLKVALILTLAILVLIPAIFVWFAANERFLFSRNLDFEYFIPSLNATYVNLTDSGKLVALLYVQMDYPQSEATDVPLLVRIDQLSDTEVDSLVFSFGQYGYDSVYGFLDASSSIPPDKFGTSGDLVMSANDLGSHGIGNITLNFVLNLAHSYHESGANYDVDLQITLSMHHKALMQLTSLSAEIDTIQVHVSPS